MRRPVRVFTDAFENMLRYGAPAVFKKYNNMQSKAKIRLRKYIGTASYEIAINS